MSNNDFYAPEFEERVFTRNGVSKTFRVRELSGDEAEKLFDIRDKQGKTDANKVKGLDSRIIATSVVEFDGVSEVPITLDQAGKLPAKFRRELVKIAMDINGLNDGAGEAVARD